MLAAGHVGEATGCCRWGGVLRMFGALCCPAHSKHGSPWASLSSLQACFCTELLLFLPFSHAGEFLEVYMAVPIEVCEQRDPKGLYKKVGRGGS